MAILIWTTKISIYPDGKLTQALVQQRFSDVIYPTDIQWHHNIICINFFFSFPLAKPEVSKWALGSNTGLLQSKQNSLMHVIWTSNKIMVWVDLSEWWVMNRSPSMIKVFLRIIKVGKDDGCQIKEIWFGETRLYAVEILRLFKKYKEEYSIMTKEICKLGPFIKDSFTNV